MDHADIDLGTRKELNSINYLSRNLDLEFSWKCNEIPNQAQPICFFRSSYYYENFYAEQTKLSKIQGQYLILYSVTIDYLAEQT